MPTVYIGEKEFDTLVSHYGYREAKQKCQDLVRRHATELNSDE